MKDMTKTYKKFSFVKIIYNRIKLLALKARKV